jgi:DNA-binding CsgD family transcriptional regulator
MLLERSEQLGLLRSALAGVTGGSRGKVVLVSGEAGIGKTALLREFCDGLGGSARALWATCDSLFTPRPLGPLLDLGVATRGDVETRVGDRSRPFEVTASLLRELALDGPAVLVLEDTHWADEATLDVIRLLARRLDRIALLLVLSYRDDQLGRSHPLRIVLGDVPTGDQLVRIELRGLSREAVTVLAEPSGVDPEQLHHRTGGNPFFVTEVLAAGTERIPATVRDAVLARAARLSPQALTVLDTVAVVPGRAERWLVEELAPHGAAAPLDECLGSGMLTTDDGWVAFRHEIARLVVQDSQPPGHRAALHRDVLTVLVDRPEAGPDLARLAHHAEAAGDAEAVLRFAPAAAEQAAAAGARREAVAEYARALRFAHRMPPPERAELLERFAGEGYFTGLGDEATVALREVLAIHRERGDLAGQGRALRQLGRQLGLDGDVFESRAVSHEAVAVLERLPAGAELARTYATLSANYGLTDAAEAIRWGRKAIALAERAECTDALIYALNNVGTVELRRGDPAGLAKLERSRDIALRSGDEAGVGRALLHLALVLVTRREWALADGYLDAGIDYCSEHGLDAWRSWLRALRAESILGRGRWAEAADAAASILSTEPEVFAYSRGTALVILARARARRGEAGYRPPLDQASQLAKPASTPQFQLMLASARAELAWLEGAPAARIADETDDVLGLEMTGVPWFAGEVACWRWRVGLPGGEPERLAEPYRLELSGDVRGAARWWMQRECPYDAALALAGSSEADELREALDMLRDLGARPAAAIVARRLRALGERGIRRGPRPGTSANPAGLTERERQVVALVAGGLTNSDIAAELVVSARTVDHHVAAILRKLGVPSRAEAIIEAMRLGLAHPSSGARGHLV